MDCSRTPPQPPTGGLSAASASPSPSSSSSSSSSMSQPSPSPASTPLVSATFQKRFAAGGGAGVITKLATAPLERAKSLMQVQGMMGFVGGKVKYPSVAVTLSRVVREEGVVALYRGCGANIVRIAPAYAFKFSLTDHFKRLVASPGQRVGNLSLVQLISAATLAGLLQTFLTYPLESLRQRLYISNSLGHNLKETGIPYCIKRTWRSEGLRGFYRGLPVGLATGAPFVGVEMTAYDLLMRQAATDAEGVARVPYQFICGAMAGVLTQTVLYPLDTVWRRVMCDGIFDTPKRYTSSLNCVSVTLKEEGVAGLFAGVGANALRAFPAAGIQFMAYDILKSFLMVS
eukprot:TRINITY_DN8580_c0_g1_i1.p1 TRINITY_DN8580_c0_g1~~TRINITY_DN8580_c0_g1_i1.p1  ORF type:complete len:352 (+),score=82.57 TRINITY_DN8580_c0_g1_i1:27-1058(+)